MKHEDVVAGRWDWLAHAILERKVIHSANGSSTNTKNTGLRLDASPCMYYVGSSYDPNPTTTIYRPFYPHEIRLGWIIRPIGGTEQRAMITGVFPENVVTPYAIMNFERLLKDYEYLQTTMSGETWAPCGVKVNE